MTCESSPRVKPKRLPSSKLVVFQLPPSWAYERPAALSVSVPDTGDFPPGLGVADVVGGAAVGGRGGSVGSGGSPPITARGNNTANTTGIATTAPPPPS